MTEIDFNSLLTMLRDNQRPLPPTALYAFWDLSPQQLNELKSVWPHIDVERRRNLLHDLGELEEADFDVSFADIYRLALEDEDACVRATAISNMWEDESPLRIDPLLEFMYHDPAVEVRAAAAGALGQFVYLGAIDELPAAQARRVEEALLNIIQGNDDTEVRRRALESIAFATRPEVAPLIRVAYAAPDEKMRASALFAMGRTADNVWAPQILAELERGAPPLRFEAARAAGELELAEAVPALQQLIEEGDIQCREAAIWSLGQIGGDAARTTLLKLLEETDDEEEVDFIEDALDNLAFTDGTADFFLFDFAEESESNAEADNTED